MLRALSLAVALGLLAACPPSKVCTPGKSEPCTCTSGASGAQTCNAEGTGLGACECSVADSGVIVCGGPGAPDCGAHGVCADASTGAHCTCSAGYQGATCGQCASGYQDNDSNSTCLPTCATAALTCGGRGACQDASGVARCDCYPGYDAGAPAADGGLSCAWTGVVLDPGFQGTPASAWTLDGGMLLVPGDPGNLEPGVARAPTTVTINTLVQQSGIDMPPPGVADNFAVRFSTRDEYVGFGTHEYGGVVRLGAAVAPWTLPSSWATSLLCLGEGAFGPGLTLTAQPFPTAANSGQHVIDHLEVLPADCPAPGTVLNGTFEGAADAGWTFRGLATVVSGGGVNGSRALRLSNATICSLPGAATGVMSVPLAATLPNPALQFTMVGTSGKSMVVSSVAPIREVVASGGLQTVTTCLGSWPRGNAVPLTFALAPNLGGGLCTDPDVRQADIDNVAIVSDATCAATQSLYNPGFETDDLGTAWIAATQYGATARLLQAPATAHTGNGSLQLMPVNVCGTVAVRQVISLPPSAANGGPAVHFWYQGDPLGGPAFARLFPWAPAYATVPLSSLTLPASAGWTQRTLCASGLAAGMPVVLAFEITGPGGSCATASSAALLFDDVQAGTDPSCPP